MEFNKTARKMVIKFMKSFYMEMKNKGLTAEMDLTGSLQASARDPVSTHTHPQYSSALPLRAVIPTRSAASNLSKTHTHNT